MLKFEIGAAVAALLIGNQILTLAVLFYFGCKAALAAIYLSGEAY